MSGGQHGRSEARGPKRRALPALRFPEVSGDAGSVCALAAAWAIGGQQKVRHPEILAACATAGGSRLETDPATLGSVLSRFGVRAAVEHGGESLQALDHWLHRQEFVLMPLFLADPGSSVRTRRWVGLDGFGEGYSSGYTGMDPQRGRTMLPRKVLSEAWSLTGRLAVRVDSRPGAVARPLWHASASGVGAPGTHGGQGPVPAWMTPLAGFLGQCSVLPPGRLPPTFQLLLEAAKARISEALGADNLHLLRHTPGPANRSVRFLVEPQVDVGRMATMVLIEDGCLVGGLGHGTAWVDEAVRGRGLGAEMVIAAHANPPHRFLCPTTYSQDGFRARLSAHRIAVERALLAHHVVPEPVLRDYVVDGGRLRLADPEKWRARMEVATPQPQPQPAAPRPSLPMRHAKRAQPAPALETQMDLPF